MTHCTIWVKKNAHIQINVRQVYKGEIEEKLLSRSLQPLNDCHYEQTRKHCQI